MKLAATLLFFLSLLAFNTGCPRGFMQDHSDHPIYLTDSPESLNENWVLTSLWCDGEISAFWQQQSQSAGLQINWQIKKGQAIISLSDFTGCGVTVSESLVRS